MPFAIFGDANGNGISGGGSSIEFIESNGNIDTSLKSGATIRTYDSTGALIARVADTDRPMRVAKVALSATAGNGGCFAWANPESVSIIITRVEIDVTTIATAACTIDIGTTAVSAATSSDTLLDGLDVNTAAGVFDNITDKGVNGKSRQKLASGKWVTGTQASGAIAGLVGFAYIHYHLV